MQAADLMPLSPGTHTHTQSLLFEFQEVDSSKFSVNKLSLNFIMKQTASNGAAFHLLCYRSACMQTSVFFSRNISAHLHYDTKDVKLHNNYYVYGAGLPSFALLVLSMHILFFVSSALMKLNE